MGGVEHWDVFDRFLYLRRHWESVGILPLLQTVDIRNLHSHFDKLTKCLETYNGSK